jgi:hypothetical protein
MGMSGSNKGWTKVGEKTVNLSKNEDHGEINISGNEKLSSIKLKVDNAAMVDLQDIEVEFEGGGKQSVDMTNPMNSSTGESQVIELKSNDKSIKKVNFVYKSRDNASMDSKDNKDSKAKVEVWGMKANTAQR